MGWSPPSGSTVSLDNALVLQETYRSLGVILPVARSILGVLDGVISHESDKIHE